MDTASNSTVTLGADGIGDDNICADRDANEQVYQQINHERICTDSGQGFIARELPDHSNIGRIEQLLQNARRRKRNGKPQNLTTERSVQHIHIRL